MLAYLHIPFCDSKCHYCSFNSYTTMHHKIENYMQALTRSLQRELENYKVEQGSLETLFIGGGTPSVVPAALYAPIFQTIRPYLSKDAEITSEVNPNSASREWLEGMYTLGVNRLSFGVQSFQEQKLSQLNRAHSAKEAIDAITTAAHIGYQNLSLDIIYDFISDSKELLQSDLEQAFALPINHISSYELTIEKATHFTKTPWVKQNNNNLGFFLRDFILKQGFMQYEVSNYGTYQSRHNRGYWQYKNYLGIGAGAVGCVDGVRYYPHSNIELFIKEPHFQRLERLSAEDILTEKIFLGLRCNVGVAKHILPPAMQTKADILEHEGRLVCKNGIYYNQDYFLSDELALFLST